MSVLARSALGGIAVLLACGDAPEHQVEPDEFIKAAHHQAVEALRLGGPNSAEPASFARILRVLVGPDELIYVLDEGRREITVFDSSGTFVRRIGARGPGPGEFDRPGRMGFLGDTLWVQDRVRRKTHLFAITGEFLRTTDLTMQIDTARFRGRDLPLAMLEQGVAVGEPVNPRIDMTRDATAPIVRVDLSSGQADTLLERSVWRDRVLLPGIGVLLVKTVENYPLLAIDGLGRTIVAVDRARPILEDNVTSIRITKWAPRGRAILVKEFEGFRPVPVTSAEKERLLDGAVEALERTMDQLQSVRRQVNNPRETMKAVFRVADQIPSIADARAMHDGTVWIRLSAGDTVQTWAVVDRSGRVAGRVSLPVGVRVEDATASRVWAIAKDEMDIDYLVSFRLLQYH